ncbi:MAG TPA: RES family NAD+ phosphorylase [Opitutaceae bacterium]|nr:RES family NAD+ phosphorylase [Opitutaceae bacterium]
MSEIVLWRLCAQHREPWAFTGEGSARRGGRWNPPGVRVIYCAESRSLAALEVLVNVDQPARLFLTAWIMVPAVASAELVEKPARVPENWRDTPHSAATQAFGAAWVRERRSAVLRVPSTVVPGEFNYLINPLHPDFKRVKIGKPERFTFDARLAS